jgi:GLTT repeat-containing protein
MTHRKGEPILKKIAIVSITAAALIAFQAQAHGGSGVNGLGVNGLSANGLTMNGLTANGLTVNGLTVNGLAMDTDSPSAITIELPQQAASTAE